MKWKVIYGKHAQQHTTFLKGVWVGVVGDWECSLLSCQMAATLRLQIGNVCFYPDGNYRDYCPGAISLMKSLRLIRKWGTHRFHLPVASLNELQVYLSTWRGRYHGVHSRMVAPTLAVGRHDVYTQRAHHAMIMSLWRRDDVPTSFWRHNDVIIASCAIWVVAIHQQKVGID